jgi:hypothetical protein
MMFNGLDRPFELLNLRYRPETQNILCFANREIISLLLFQKISIFLFKYKKMNKLSAMNELFNGKII